MSFVDARLSVLARQTSSTLPLAFEAAQTEEAPMRIVYQSLNGVIVIMRRGFRITLTELSNLARLRLPPSTMLSRLISVLPRCSLFVLLETEPAAPSPLLYPFNPSLWISWKLPCVLDPLLLKPERERAFLTGPDIPEAEPPRRPRSGDALLLFEPLEAGLGSAPP